VENNKVKKESSSIMKDAIILFLITLISGLALGYVYEITKAPIKVQQEEAKLEAYQKVFSDANSLVVDEDLQQTADGIDLISLDPTFKNITIDEINKALDSSNNLIGYIVVVTTPEGYGGDIQLAIGYRTDGSVTGMEVLKMSETADLGTKSNEPEFKNQFKGKKVDQFAYTKDGATEDNQIDAISGATITTKAVVNAVNAGIGFIKEYADLGGAVNE